MSQKTFNTSVLTTATVVCSLLFWPHASAMAAGPTHKIVPTPLQTAADAAMHGSAAPAAPRAGGKVKNKNGGAAQKGGGKWDGQSQPITGGIEVRLVFTDANGKPQDYSLATAPAAFLSTLTPRLQAVSKSPVLEPGFFFKLWSEASQSVCQDVDAQVTQTINGDGIQAYDVSCKPLKLGVLYAAMETNWQIDALNTAKGTRLVLEYYVPPLNRVPFLVRTGATCQKSKSWWFCAADPKFTLFYDVALQVTATSSDPTVFKVPVTLASDSGMAAQALLNGAQYDKQVDKAVSDLEVKLGSDALTAVADWETAAIKAVFDTLKFLVFNAGALVADAANKNLPDEVSAKLSVLGSSAAGKAAARASDAFTPVWLALESAQSLGFTQVQVGIGPKQSLQLRAIYPTPGKPQVTNTTVASNKGVHLTQPSITTKVSEVKPGASFPVDGQNFLLPSTNDLSISWSHTVAGQATKTDLQWGPKGGKVQDTEIAGRSFDSSVNSGSYTASNLNPGTTYQFRVHECDTVTCAPWSDWLYASTQRGGSSDVVVWLDGNSSHAIGHGTALANGSFQVTATVPAGTSQGAHMIHAAYSLTKGKDKGQLATADITVCGSAGCGPSIAVIDGKTGTALSPPVGLASAASFTLRGSHFSPGAAVTLHLDGATGPKLGTATADKAGMFVATFQLPMSAGSHKLFAVQSSSGAPVDATEAVVLIAQPK
jgi:hypothetical protein